MNRNYKLDKETTQRLLDLAVEDNLVKLHKKVGTKGELFKKIISADPGSRAFFCLWIWGSGMELSGSGTRNYHHGAYFRELSDKFLC
jgi:hypothetical protein